MITNSTCEACGSAVSPVLETYRKLEREFVLACGWSEVRPVKPYGIKGLIIPNGPIASIEAGKITPSQVVERAMSQLPRDAKLFANDISPFGLVRQVYGTYGIGANAVYILIASHEWDETKQGESFGRYEIKWPAEMYLD